MIYLLESHLKKKKLLFFLNIILLLDKKPILKRTEIEVKKRTGIFRNKRIFLIIDQK
jgi:hypothetical protein